LLRCAGIALLLLGLATGAGLAAEAGLPAEAAGISTAADADGPAQIAFPPPSDPGPVVVLISGQTGFPLYRDYADRISKLGYYAVLLDGNDMPPSDQQGVEKLRQAIARAAGAAKAIAGKAAVIGFSLGGGAALSHAVRMPSLVSVVVAYFPDTGFIGRDIDMSSFVAKFEVPVLALAGAKDTYKNCCLIQTIRSMDTKPKGLGVPMQLVVYPQAKHDFIGGADYRADDAADAWKRTTEALRQHLGK
jgi:dienelactone hydrolase